LPKRIASEEGLHIKASELEATEVIPQIHKNPITEPQKGRKEDWVDPLTGLFNEKYLEDFLHRNEFKSKEGKEPLALVFTRIRHFKNFNKRRGKEVGDETIKGVARIFQENLKGRDLLCRCYGSTFGIMLDGTDKENAIGVGKKLKGLVEDTHGVLMEGKNKEPIFLNVVVSSYPNEFLTPHSILSQGVQALNEAEQKSRDDIITL
jgi:diguanylate cyclase (GGDEF)-like protein